MRKGRTGGASDGKPQLYRSKTSTFPVFLVTGEDGGRGGRRRGASSSPWLVLEFLPRHILQRILGRVRPASSDLDCSNMAEDGRRAALYLLVLCLVIFCSVFFLARLRHGRSGLYCCSMEGEVRMRVALHLVLREPDQFPSPKVSSILTTH